MMKLRPRGGGLLALEVHGSGVVYNGCNRADAGAHVRDRVAGLVVPGM